jgi:type VI secretion system protein ImpE
MNSAELVQSGQLEEGLNVLQGEIRAKPEDTRLRIFLFQLNCVLGRVEKALTQLQVLAGLNADTMLMAEIFRPVLLCESLRKEVFEGKRTPIIFGEPEEWMGSLIQANELAAKGEFKAASELRSSAFEAAPVTPGTVDGQAFEWIADADSRLGPMLEAFIEGKYYWIPFCRIHRIHTEKPGDLRDLVWLPAHLTWVNGGTSVGHLPVRYPGTEGSPDGPLRLARRTEWLEKPGETFLGLGQRVFATDTGEHPLLSCREIELTLPSARSNGSQGKHG